MASLETAKGKVLLRGARLSDVRAFRELRLEALREHPMAFAMDYETDLHKPDSYWQERMRAVGAETMIYFAEADGKLVGMCGVENRDSPKIRHSAWIWGVYVQREWRGLGLVEALMEACIEWARGRGVTIVKLGVATTNAPAIAAYLRCGFSVFGVEPQAIQYQGQVLDELLMARRI